MVETTQSFDPLERALPAPEGYEHGVMEAHRSGSRLAIHASTWNLKPNDSIDNHREALDTEPMAWAQYGALPPRAVEMALHDPEVLLAKANQSRRHPMDEQGGFLDWFIGNPAYEYYFHGDLSKGGEGNDDTGVGLCHYEPGQDKVVVDLILQLRSQGDWQLSFERVKHIIYSIKGRGFDNLRVSFDGWQSLQMIEELTNKGIPATTYSVDRSPEAYDTLITGILADQVDFYVHAQFFDDMRNLQRIQGNKYDHRRGAGKDVSDGVAGCVAQCFKSLTGLSLDLAGLDDLVADFDYMVVHGDVQGMPVLADIDRGLMSGPLTRILRLDSTMQHIILSMGYKEPGSNKLITDGFYVWQGDPEGAVQSVIAFVERILETFTVPIVSLNESVPLDIITHLQQQGRRVASALASNQRGQKGFSRSSPVTRKSMQVMVQQLKKAELFIPDSPELLRDLKYMTYDNQMDRVYARALAGLVEQLMKEYTTGVMGKTLATPTHMSAPRKSVQDAKMMFNPGYHVQDTGRQVTIESVRRIKGQAQKPVRAGATNAPGAARTFPRSTKV